MISGVILLVGHPVWGQQAAPRTDESSSAATDALPPHLPLSGGGGYGASSMFSPFPKDGALLPLSLKMPGQTPAEEAPRPFGVRLGVGGEEQWSDNVLSTSSGKKADFVTSVDPSVDVDVDSRSLKGSLNYDLGYDKYASTSQLDGLRQNGIGIFEAEVIDQRLFLDGRASVSEQSVSTTGPVTASNRTAASNLARVYTGSIAPRLQQRFDGWALAQISYHHDETHNENASQISSQTTPVTPSTLTAANLNDSRTDGGRLDVRSGEAFTRLLWDYTGDVNRNTSTGSTFDQVSHTVGAEYRLSADFGLLTAVGDDYLHSNYVSLSKYGGAFYDFGFHWTPSPDTDLRVGAGRRYDEADWTVLAIHWFGPKTVVRVSEDSGLTTDALSFERALNAVQRDETGSFVNPFSGLAADPSSSLFARSDAIYWQRNTTLVLRQDDIRDSFALTARISEQKLIGSPNGLVSPAAADGVNSAMTTVLEADFTWTHQMTPVITAVASVSGADIMAKTVGRSKQLKGGASLNYKMNPTLTGTLGYSMAATLPGSSGGIRENVIAVGLRKTF